MLLLLHVTHSGGRMMLIDMGGGTVDMTVHDIDSLAGGEAMSMSEATHRECLAEVRGGGLLAVCMPSVSC
jgi:hypothetical protein